ncbi:hypothetical protein [Rhodococcus sp. YH3-3]|uniref:hypothetical protein n=1 Tax=Rhodococcus sp. YH3-3 TaxID=1803579 RepID=UPI0007DB4E5D|nr:hypothetical protein [Rhodococcus sp. YH3-3]
MPESKKKDSFRQPSSRSGRQDSSEPAENTAVQQDLTELVDDLEEQVAEECRQEGVSGNRADREDALPIDTGDRAPD